MILHEKIRIAHLCIQRCFKSVGGKGAVPPSKFFGQVPPQHLTSMSKKRVKRGGNWQKYDLFANILGLFITWYW